MAHIDYYFSTISPWAYLAGDRLEKLAAEHGTTLAYKPMDLMRVFAATGGKPLGERGAARQAYRLQEIRRWRILTGLPINDHPAHFPTNPAPASYAIIAAQKSGGGDLGMLVRTLLAACFVQDRNVADDDVIRDCLEAAGFDPALADSGLLNGAMVYEANTNEAIDEGAFGSPFYIVDGSEKFWGQDRLDQLGLHLAGKL